MLVNTHSELPVDETFYFFGNPNDKMEVGDLIYLWVKKSKGGLGDEVVYGTSEIIKVNIHSQKNTYEAERIK